MALALAASGLAGVCAGQTVPCKYDVEVLPPVNCGLFQGAMLPTAINIHGTIIGYALSSCGSGPGDSYIWNGGPTLTLLPKPPGFGGFHAWDLNDNGLIAGNGLTSNGGSRVPYLYNSVTGAWHAVPQTTFGDGLYLVNNAGLTAGTRSLVGGGSPRNAYIFNPIAGILTDLGVMNGPDSTAHDLTEGGRVGGETGPYQQLSNKTRGFIHQDGRTEILPPVPGGFSSAVRDVNDNRQALVWGRVPHQSPEFVQRVFYWQDGRMEELPLLPGYERSAPAAIAPSGLAAGGCGTVPASNDWKGVLWQPGAVHDVNLLVDPVPGLLISGVVDMTDLGRIVAVGRFNNQNAVFRLTPRPRKPGDTNCDEIVNVDDLLNVINSWGPCNGCPEDFNNDGVVNHLDLLIVIQNWG